MKCTFLMLILSPRHSRNTDSDEQGSWEINVDYFTTNIRTIVGPSN